MKPISDDLLRFYLWFRWEKQEGIRDWQIWTLYNVLLKSKEITQSEEKKKTIGPQIFLALPPCPLLL